MAGGNKSRQASKPAPTANGAPTPATETTAATARTVTPVSAPPPGGQKESKKVEFIVGADEKEQEQEKDKLGALPPRGRAFHR